MTHTDTLLAVLALLAALTTAGLVTFRAVRRHRTQYAAMRAENGHTYNPHQRIAA